MTTMTDFIVVAHNPQTDEAEWMVCTGPNAEAAATHWAEKWAARDNWIAFVRPVGKVLSVHGTYSNPHAVL